MAEDPIKDTFLSHEMSITMAETMKIAFQEGYLQLAFLEINGQKAAGYLNFDYLNQHLGLQLRYQPRLYELLCRMGIVRISAAVG